MSSIPAAARRFATPLIAVLVAAAVVVTLVVVLFGGGDKNKVTAYFPMVTGLYKGDDVRIAGVPVGQIDSIDPQGTKVKVEFSYDADHNVPADARAMIVAPTLVTSRFIQLAPTYDGGPVLEDGAEIGLDRTAVPVEWDEIKQQLSRLATSLGPEAGGSGPLSGVLDVAASNLAGQGQNLHDTLAGLSKAIETLSDGRKDLFGTVRNLQVFTTALAASDQQIVEFGGRLATVSEVLADNRAELGSALSILDDAFREVEGFVRGNREGLVTSLQGLTDVTRNLVESRADLEQILHVTPTAIVNFYNIYTPIRGSLTGVFGLSNIETPTEFVCSGIASAAALDPAAGAKLCANTLAPLLNMLALNYPPIGLNPVNRNGSEPIPGADYGATPRDPARTPFGNGSALPGLPGLLLPGGGG